MPSSSTRVSDSITREDISSDNLGGFSPLPGQRKAPTASTVEACPPEDASFQERDDPRTDVEKILATLWQDVLGIQHIGVNDNFFDLGGHSLMAVTLVSETNRALRGQFALSSLIAAPTIREFAELVEHERPGERAKGQSVTRSTIAQQVREFVVDSYLLGHANGLKNSDSFRDHGIIDEMGVLQLAEFLEETYSIAIPQDLLASGKLDSIESVSRYVEQSLNGPEVCGAVAVSMNMSEA